MTVLSLVMSVGLQKVQCMRIMFGSRKSPYSPTEMIGIPVGRRESMAKNLKEMYQA